MKREWKDFCRWVKDVEGDLFEAALIGFVIWLALQ